MWSFGHLAVLCFIIGFVVYFMVENRVRRLFDEEKKNRAGGNAKMFLAALFSYLFILSVPLFPDCFLKRDGELVRTACAFRATLNALETGNHVFCLLAFDQ
jgi:hypothetical protein